MGYNPGNYSNNTALASYPVTTLPTAAMRAYGAFAPPGHVGQGLTAGLENGSGFVCARVGRKRSLALVAVNGLNQRGYHFT